MSRVIWGHGDSASNSTNNNNSSSSNKKQTTLEGFVTAKPSLARRRNREEVVEDTNSNTNMMLMMNEAIQNSVANGEDGVQWGPSGGRDRETQRRRQQRPFMMGKERSAAFDKSSYSRDFIKEWQNVRSEQESEWTRNNNSNSSNRNQNTLKVKKEEEEDSGVKQEGGRIKNEQQGDDHYNMMMNQNQNQQPKVFMQASAKGTTEMDPALIAARFLGPTCPRDLFRGKCFFLNSCDADPLISVYQLEKVIRFLGGTTSMGVSTRVSYILTQHLSSAKEAKLLRDFDEVRDLDTNGTRKQNKNSSSSSSNNSSGKRVFPKCVHPHFVIACCREGRIVSLDKYLTTPKCLQNNNTTSHNNHDSITNSNNSKDTTTQKATSNNSIVILDDDDDDDDKKQKNVKVIKSLKKKSVVSVDDEVIELD